MTSLLPKLPQNILAVTFAGDLLLPASKNASLFINAVQDARAAGAAAAKTANAPVPPSRRRRKHSPPSASPCPLPPRSSLECDNDPDENVDAEEDSSLQEEQDAGGDGDIFIRVQHFHDGPFYLPHGFGLHSSWSLKASAWLKTVTL